MRRENKQVKVCDSMFENFSDLVLHFNNVDGQMVKIMILKIRFQQCFATQPVVRPSLPCKATMITLLNSTWDIGEVPFYILLQLVYVTAICHQVWAHCDSY